MPNSIALHAELHTYPRHRLSACERVGVPNQRATHHPRRSQSQRSRGTRA